jgi:hypothetical protein
MIVGGRGDCDADGRINPGMVQPESYKPCSLRFGIQEPWNRVGELRWKIVVGGKELRDCV